MDIMVQEVNKMMMERDRDAQLVEDVNLRNKLLQANKVKKKFMNFSIMIVFVGN